MKQLILIGGGAVFPDNDAFCKQLETREYNPFEEKKKWKDTLKEKLDGLYQLIFPTMPNKQNASYKARKIRFEKIFPYLNDKDLVLIGHSLGGMFLLKYLSENQIPKNIKQLHLISSCIDESRMPDKEKYLGDFLFDLEKIPKIQEKADQIFVYHSTDDPVVPYSHAENLVAYLPTAKLITFTDRGHLNQPEFPELLENIIK